MGRLTKDRRDLYYRMGKELELRARSAFKLLQVDQEVGLFDGHEAAKIIEEKDKTSEEKDRTSDDKKSTRKIAVDLCAAPGSWTQILLGGGYDAVIAVDLQEMNLADIRPITRDKVERHMESIMEKNEEMESIMEKKSHVPLKKNSVTKVNAMWQYADVMSSSTESIISRLHCIRGDITSPETSNLILEILNGNEKCSTDKSAEKSEKILADIVVIDGAPDVSGVHDFDEYIQHNLIKQAVRLSSQLLKPGGNFCSKLFRGPRTGDISEWMKQYFKEVVICKPRASRFSSPEVFIVGKGFFSERKSNGVAETAAIPAETKFYGCSFNRNLPDSDRSYALKEGHVFQKPTQAPITPFYEEALKIKRGNLKTKQ